MKTTSKIAAGILLLFFIYSLNRYCVEQYHFQNGLVWLVALVFIGMVLAIRKAVKSGRLHKSRVRRPFSEKIKENVVIRQKHRCASCSGLLNVIHYDHRNGNRSDNSKNNCSALCPNCHARKTIIERDGRKWNHLLYLEAIDCISWLLSVYCSSLLRAVI